MNMSCLFIYIYRIKQINKHILSIYTYVYNIHIVSVRVCALHLFTLHFHCFVAPKLVAEAGYDPDSWKSQLYPNEIARDAQHGRGSNGHGSVQWYHSCITAARYL